MCVCCCLSGNTVENSQNQTVASVLFQHFLPPSSPIPFFSIFPFSLLLDQLHLFCASLSLSLFCPQENTEEALLLLLISESMVRIQHSLENTHSRLQRLILSFDSVTSTSFSVCFRLTVMLSWAGFLNTTMIVSSACSRPLWCTTCWL